MANFNDLASSYSQSLTNVNYPNQFYAQIMPDKRTDREKLIALRECNQKQVDLLIVRNQEIDEALELLDKHPLLERINDLIKKLVG